jgi:hypothetical protein
LRQELKFDILGVDAGGKSFPIGEAIINVTELCDEGVKTNKRVALRRPKKSNKQHSVKDVEDAFHNISSGVGVVDDGMQEINAYINIVAEPVDPHSLVWDSHDSPLKLGELQPAQTCRIAQYGNVPIPSLLEYLWRQAIEAGAMHDQDGLAYVLGLPADSYPVSPSMRNRFDEEKCDVERDISNMRFNAALVGASAVDVSNQVSVNQADRTKRQSGRYSSMVYFYLWKTIVGQITPKLLSPASFQNNHNATNGNISLEYVMTNLDDCRISEIEGLLRLIPEPGYTVLLWVLDRIIDIFEQGCLHGLDLRQIARAVTPMLWSIDNTTSLDATNNARGKEAIQLLAATELVLRLLYWRKRWRQYASSFVGPLIELQASKEVGALSDRGSTSRKSSEAPNFLSDKQQISEGDESLLNVQSMDEIKSIMDFEKSKSSKKRLVITALTAHKKFGVAVGTHLGETFVFSHVQKLQSILPGTARCAVNCLAFAESESYLAVGYLNADLSLFDFKQQKLHFVYHEKRQLRSLDDPKMQAFKKVAFLSAPAGSPPQIVGVDSSRAVWHLR